MVCYVPAARRLWLVCATKGNRPVQRREKNRILGTPPTPMLDGQASAEKANGACPSPNYNMAKCTLVAGRHVCSRLSNASSSGMQASRDMISPANSRASALAHARRAFATSNLNESTQTHWETAPHAVIQRSRRSTLLSAGSSCSHTWLLRNRGNRHRCIAVLAWHAKLHQDSQWRRRRGRRQRRRWRQRRRRRQLAQSVSKC